MGRRVAIESEIAGPGQGAAERGTALRSPIAWALLGLVIRRASYGYELAQRFERTYGKALELSSPSQVYSSLDTLERHGLVEQFVPMSDAEAVRQPKPNYRATGGGVREYRSWLIAQLEDRRRRSQVFVLQLALLPSSEALAVIAECERACLARARRIAPADAATRAGAGAGIGAEQEDGGDLAARLLLEQDRLALEAKLAWIEYARRELTALAATAAAGAPDSPAAPLAPVSVSVPGVTARPQAHLRALPSPHLPAGR